MTVLGVFFDYPILILPVLALFLAVGIGALRTKNSLGMDLDIFDEESDGDTNDLNVEEQIEEQIEITDEDAVDENYIMEMVEESLETVSKPRLDATVGKDSSQAPRQVARRRTRKTPTKKDGPITAVKRKRLDGGGEVIAPKKTTRKKAVSKSPVRKTRRVVTKSDKVDDDSPGER